MKKKILAGIAILSIALISTLNVNAYEHLTEADDQGGGGGGGPTCTGELCDEANGLKYNSSNDTCCGKSAEYRGRKAS